MTLQLLAGVPGQVTDSDTACAPAFPSKGFGGGFVCIAHPEVGATFGGSSGFSLCTYWGMLARSNADAGSWTCQDQANVLPGDIAAFEGTASKGASICGGRGLDVTDKTVNGFTVKVCTGSLVPPSPAPTSTATVAPASSGSGDVVKAVETSNALVWSLGIVLVVALLCVLFLQVTNTFGKSLS